MDSRYEDAATHPYAGCGLKISVRPVPVIRNIRAHGYMQFVVSLERQIYCFEPFELQ